ncbi:hypothetical protein Hte_011376 [Hypoxylon texense]
MASPPRPILKRKSSWDQTTPSKIRCMEEIEGVATTTTTHSSSSSSSSSVSFSATATTAVVVFSDVATDMETGEHVPPSSRSREDFVRAAGERRSVRMLEMFRAREERFAAEIEAASRKGFGPYDDSDEDLFPNGRNDDGEEESDSGLSDEEEEGEGEGGEEEEEEEEEEEKEVVERFSKVEIEGESHKDLDGDGDGDGGSGGNDTDADADDFEIVFAAEETSDEGLDGSADDEWGEDDEEEDEDDSDDDEDMDPEGGCALTWDFQEEDK